MNICLRKEIPLAGMPFIPAAAQVLCNLSGGGQRDSERI